MKMILLFTTLLLAAETCQADQLPDQHAHLSPTQRIYLCETYNDAYYLWATKLERGIIPMARAIKAVAGCKKSHKKLSWVSLLKGTMYPKGAIAKIRSPYPQLRKTYFVVIERPRSTGHKGWTDRTQREMDRRIRLVSRDIADIVCSLVRCN